MSLIWGTERTGFFTCVHIVHMLCNVVKSYKFDFMRSAHKFIKLVAKRLAFDDFYVWLKDSPFWLDNLY